MYTKHMMSLFNKENQEVIMQYSHQEYYNVETTQMQKKIKKYEFEVELLTF